MTTHRDSAASPNPSNPNRKLCTLCAKPIYLHQPILYCPKCNKLFHGKCLNLRNDKIFILQQLSWHCLECCKKYSQHIRCNNCDNIVDPYKGTYSLCKICNNIYHVACLFEQKCSTCIPEFNLSNSEHSNLTNSEHADYYGRLNNENEFNDLPYFSPFNCIDRQITAQPDPDELSNQIHAATQILQTCKYYNIQQFCEIVAQKKGNILIAWNIDGLRTNFDKFCMFNNSINLHSRCITAYVLCETNVTYFEAQPFHLSGYNKFISDRIKISNNKYKHKGSGLMILLDENLKDASIDTELSRCTPDSEFLVVRYLYNCKLVFIVGVYRPPSGSVDAFFENFEILMAGINYHSKNQCHILGDLNLNLYNPTSKNVDEYLDCIFSNNLFPLISRATHFKGINPTCIDHILTNNVSETQLSGIILNNI